MDNFQVDVTCRGLDVLKKVFMLFAAKHAAVVGWKVKDNRLILYWTSNGDLELNKFPFEMSLEKAAEFAMDWLEQTANYGEEPDMDGHCTKGWRVHNDDWGHIGKEWHAFIAVEPEWALHGK